jgi:hypothetical protein
MVDDAWQTRIPQGWIRYPDGTIGPPNQPSPIDQAWQTRIPAPGQVPTPGGGMTSGSGPSGTMLPGSGVLPRSANAGAPTMGYPAMGGASLNTTGPQIFPPNSRPIAPNKQVGRFTGGTSTENAPRGGFNINDWWKADPNATFEAGKPMGNAAAGGSFPNIPLSGAAIIPSILAGTTVAGWKYGDPALQKMSVDPRLDAAGTGGFDVTQPLGAPQPTGAPSNGYRPEDDPSPGPAPNPFGAGMPRGSPPIPRAAAPPGAPSPAVTTAPAATAPGVTPPPINGRVNPASVNLGNNPWVMMSRPNANPGIGGGMLGGGSLGGARGTGGPPQMGMLDLSRLFGGGQPQQQQQAAPAGPAIGSPAPAVPPPRPRGALAPPTPGPMDPSIIAHQNMAGSGPMDPSIIARIRQMQQGYNGPDALSPIGVTQ